VLVVAGSSESNPPAIVAPEVAAQLPRGELAVLDHLGHFGPMQDPSTVARLIHEFADRIT
jgi:pimeloyl-ACP methyl ester carboxylesterase